MLSVREQIRESARSIFVDEGVAGISMRRVAAEVGVTPTAIYRHYPDKAALITAIVDEGFALLEAKLRRASKGLDGVQALRRLLDAYVDFAIAHPSYYDAMFVLPRKDARRFPDDFQAGASHTFNIVMDIVADAVEQGELRADDVLEVSLTIWAQAHGLAALYRSGRFGEHPRRFRQSAQRAVQRLFDGLTP